MKLDIYGALGASTPGFVLLDISFFSWFLTSWGFQKRVLGVLCAFFLIFKHLKHFFCNICLHNTSFLLVLWCCRRLLVGAIPYLPPKSGRKEIFARLKINIWNIMKSTCAIFRNQQLQIKYRKSLDILKSFVASWQCTAGWLQLSNFGQTSLIFINTHLYQSMTQDNLTLSELTLGEPTTKFSGGAGDLDKCLSKGERV